MRSPAAIGYPAAVTRYDENLPVPEIDEPEIDAEVPVADALDQRTGTTPDPRPELVPEREVSDTDAADQATPVTFDEDDEDHGGNAW